MSRFRRPDTLVDMAAVAALLEVEKATVRMWRTRRVLPDPDYVLAMGPVWWSSTIEAWAKQSGRWLY